MEDEVEKNVAEPMRQVVQILSLLESGTSELQILTQDKKQNHRSWMICSSKLSQDQNQDQNLFLLLLLRLMMISTGLSSRDFPGGSDSKASVYNVGDPGSIPGSGRSSGEGNGNPLRYYCLENPMDRGAWQTTVHGVAKSQTQLSDFTFTFSNREESGKLRPCKMASLSCAHAGSGAGGAKMNRELPV